MQSVDTKTIERHGFTAEINIYPDEDASNPRKEFDNFGTMLCCHRLYDLGDEDRLSADEVMERAKECEAGGGIVLPLYLYDHSGITMNTTGFSCPWDSGQVGVIFATAETIRKEFAGKGGRITKKVRERATACLVGEVETYDQYLTGDVYGFIVKLVDDEGETLPGNEEDSCWGFFGSDYCMQEAESIANWMLEKAHKDKIEHTKTMIRNRVPLAARVSA